MASILLGIAGASLGWADTVVGTRSANGFTSDDGIHWGLIGVNDFYVASGTTVSTTNGISTTVAFRTGGTGATFEQCPTSTCTWNGNFAPGQDLLSDLNFNTGGSSGAIILSFGTGVAGIGFQLEPNAAPAASGETLTFATEIAVYDGSTLLDTFYFPFGSEEFHAANSSAGFYGVTDLSGADITSIQVLAYNCGSVGGACDGFAINQARIEDAAGTGNAAATPEPGSLALLGSGLGMLAFLRRKLAARR